MTFGHHIPLIFLGWAAVRVQQQFRRYYCCIECSTARTSLACTVRIRHKPGVPWLLTNMIIRLKRLHNLTAIRVALISACVFRLDASTAYAYCLTASSLSHRMTTSATMVNVKHVFSHTIASATLSFRPCISLPNRRTAAVFVGPRLLCRRRCRHRLSASTNDAGGPAQGSPAAGLSGEATEGALSKDSSASGQGFAPERAAEDQRQSAAAVAAAKAATAARKRPKKPPGPPPPPRGNNLLVIGLGNPGDKFKMTRHNAGFLVAEELARRYGGALKIKGAFQGEYCSVTIKGKSVGILRPITFMNNSGQSARKVIEYFKLPTTAALVLVDEVALDFGQLRLKTKGSAGGHNGLKSMQAQLKTPDYARLRIGIGGAPGYAPLSDHVLGEFSRSEKKELDSVVAEACDAVQHWIEEDNIAKVMTRWNGGR